MAPAPEVTGSEAADSGEEPKEAGDGATEGVERPEKEAGDSLEGKRSEEEVELVARIRRRGHAVWYDPAIRVRHRIHADRLTRRWYFRRMYWQGYTDGRQSAESSTRYLLWKAKEIVDTVFRPQTTYVAGASRIRRMGHMVEQLGKMAGRLQKEAG